MKKQSPLEKLLTKMWERSEAKKKKKDSDIAVDAMRNAFEHFIRIDRK